MKAFSTKRIKVAAENRSRLDLSSKVITTNDFGSLQITYCREVVPGDKFSGNVKAFCRLAPMPVPTFANIRMIQNCYFVKARSIWRPFDDFYAGRKTYLNGSSTQYNEVPHITNDLLFELFNTVGEGVLVERVVDPDGSDIDPSMFKDYTFDFAELFDTEENFYYLYKLTTKGKRLYSLLRSVGINFNYTNVDQTKISIMPLLAYARIFYDYYLPKRYSNVNKLREALNRYAWTPVLAQSFLLDLADFLYIYYDDDYFTSSWETPNQPITEQYTAGDIKVNDPTNFVTQSGNNFASALYEQKYGAALTGPNNSAITSVNNLKISQFAINALKKVYDYGMRKGLAGNKYFDAIFSQFGIQLPELQLDMALSLGSSTVGAMLQDVTSLAQTDNNGSITALGDYAGKGYVNDDSFNVNFSANDYGYLIVTTHIIPDTGYVQGLNRENLHIGRLDFFNPEFDKLGMQALAEKELFNDFRNNKEYSDYLAGTGNTDLIFGYTPRYSEYKIGRDILNGDFALSSIGKDDDAYHTFRMFPPTYFKATVNRNTSEFRILDPTLQGSNFTRMFNDTNTDVDHFICSFSINMTAERKMSSLQDSIELDGSDTISVKTD